MWVDAAGQWPVCDCQGADGFDYYDPHTWELSRNEIFGIKTGFSIARTRGRMPGVIDQVVNRIRRKQVDLTKAITSRRKISLKKLEEPVRRLEDSAQVRLDDALSELASCKDGAERRRYDPASVACDRAVAALSEVESLLNSARGLFTRR